MRRIGMWTAAIVLGSGLLAGCGGDDGSSSDAGSDASSADAGGSGDSGGGDSSYCDSLADFKTTLQDTSSASALQDFKDAAAELSDEAPDDVADDWDKIKTAFDSLEATLEENGLSFEDLNDPAAAAEAAGPEAMAAIQEEVTKIGTDLDGAGDKISEHAKSECDIDLDTSAESPSASPSS